MSLVAACPRCPAAVERREGGWTCPVHGLVPALWRPQAADYDSFAAHLDLARGIPSLLPWPLPVGWWISDFAVVHDDQTPKATLVAVSGSTDADGPVELVIVCEEPGVGLGARVADSVHADPGSLLGGERIRVRVETRLHSIWPVTGLPESTERSVAAGEVGGRWMWLVLRPASALLLLTGPLHLADLAARGPSLLDLPFGGPVPPWLSG